MSDNLGCFGCFYSKKKTPSIDTQHSSKKSISVHYSTILNNSLKNVIQSPPIQKKFPKNKPFFLYTKLTYKFVVAKITEKSFSQQIVPFKIMDQEMIQFPLEEVTPERIAFYIAKRVSGTNLLVDITCGLGGNLIQFSKECDFVIGIDISRQQLDYAYKILEKYKLQDKIDLVHIDALQLHKIKADIIFINPSFIGGDLLKDCKPDLKQLLDTAKQITQNIILQLPNNIDLQQLTYLFEGECIEIEEIIIDQKLEYYIVYYGDQASISQEEIFQLLNNTLLTERSEYKGVDLMYKMNYILKKSEKKLGQKQLLEMSYKCSKQNDMLNLFLNTLIMRKVITEEEILRPKKYYFKQGPSNAFQYVSFQSGQQSLSNESKQSSKSKQTETLYEDKLISPDEFSWQNQSSEKQNILSWKLEQANSSINYYLK